MKKNDGVGSIHAVENGRTTRRRACALLGAGMLTIAASGPASAGSRLITPRLRVIVDNDFAGDPDGLFQAAHHVLSPSVDLRFIVGSHMHRGEAWDPKVTLSAAASAAKASELLQVMGLAGRVPVIAGAVGALDDPGNVAPTPAANAIIREAMRDDTDLPLYYASGAGLTDLATALLLEPRISNRITLVWIGGPEYAGTPRPPGPYEAEYNITIDTLAAQTVFNRSDISIWQVPRSTYRQMMVGYQELRERLKPAGKLGVYLLGNLERVMKIIAQLPPARRMNLGETYILGDSPLVTLTALQSSFQPDPTSSQWVEQPRPTIDPASEYGPARPGNSIRVYTRIDARLTFEDMYAKFAQNAIQVPSR